MNRVLEYKGYFGSIEVSIEDNVLYGKLLHINDLITFEAETVGELENVFKEAVDDYLEYCTQLGKEPEKPFKGSFNVRISPENHKKAVAQATRMGISLNQFVETAIVYSLDNLRATIDHAVMNKKLDSITTEIRDLKNILPESENTTQSSDTNYMTVLSTLPIGAL